MRYNEQVNIDQVQPSGLSQPAQSHAANIRQFAEQMQQTVGKFAGLYAENLQTGAKKQAEADIPKGGVPQFKGGNGIAAQTYDGMMRTAYASSIIADSTKDFNELENTSQNLADYSAKREKIFSALNKNVDGETLKLVMPAIQKMDNGIALKIQDKELKLNKDNALSVHMNAAKTAHDAALRAFQEGDFTQASTQSEIFNSNLIELQKGDPFTYNDAVVSKMRTEAAKEWSNQNVYREIDQATAKGLDAGFNKLSELAAKTPAGYSPEEWDNVLSKKVSELNAMEREQRRLAKENAKAIERNALVSRGQEILANNIPIDPYKTDASSKEEYKAYNAFYDAKAQQIDSLDPVNRVNAKSAIIKQTGVIPLKIESDFNKSVASGSTESVIEQAELYARTQQEAPASLQQLPAETRAILEIVNSTLESGGNAEEAIKQARKFSYGLSQSEKDQVKLSSADYTKENGKILFQGLNKQLEKDFDTGFIFNNAPDASPALKAEYRNVFENKMMITGGNAELAQKLAYQDLKKVWGVTSVNGDREMMKFAPEAVYGVHGSDNKWIGEQFKKETTDAGLQGAVIAVNPHRAMREQQPSYDVMAINPKTGILEPVIEMDANGMAVRKTWKPDYTLTDEYKIAHNKPDASGVQLSAIENRKRKLALELNKGIIAASGNFKTPMNPQGFDNTTIEGITNAVNNAIAVGDASEGDRELIIKHFMEKANATK